MIERALLRFILFSSLCFAFSSTHAQYASISDTAFGSWLYGHGFSASMTGNSSTGWLLDTTSSAVLTAVKINCSGGSMENIRGIRYFKHLDTLICRYTPITSLTELPGSLRYLDCSHSNMSNSGYYIPSLAYVPHTLTYLDCSYTQMILLPVLDTSSLVYVNCSHIRGVGTVARFPKLPPMTIRLICNNANIEVLDSLPSSLTYIDCSENNIGQLFQLPVNLDTLLCYYQVYQFAGMTSIDSLPFGLRYLDCHNNSFSSFPSLPNALTYLDFSNNSYSRLITHTLPNLANTSLVKLYCYNSSLRNLSALPGTLQTLITYGDSMTIIPTLPASLDSLDCSYNQLTSLPSLPGNLTYLNCNANQVATFPTQPNSLTYLACDSNVFATFPNMSSTLAYLNCSYNNPLTGLPALPASLVYLICKFDNFPSLPSLPVSLTYLDCSNSLSLNALPALPPHLQYLDFSYASLVSNLPALPSTLTHLACQVNVFYNSISALPSLPQGLKYLDIRNTGVTCLPRIYQAELDAFYASGPSFPVISCLPNRFTALHSDVNIASMPLCSPSGSCPIYYNIAGNIHNDTSSSCTLDSLHQGIAINNIKVQLKRNNQVIQQFYSSGLGQYSFKTDSLTDYDVTVDTTQLPLSISCPTANGIHVVLSPSDSARPKENIGLTCGAPDYGVLNIYANRFRPAFTTQVSFTCGNMALLLYGVHCSPGVAGSVTTTLSGSIHYSSAAPGALVPSVSGNVLTYNIADLDSLHQGSLDIIVSTDSTAIIDSQVCITTIVSSATPDVNPYNDTLTQCFTVIGSYDPNYKMVSPTDAIEAGKWLTYTVHFQNTGNDTAYTVIVQDTLSPYVDASSFQYLASSSKALIQLVGNVMTATFPDIDLVDSAASAALSQGWIEYKVKAKADLHATVQVKNTAYIYFDLNPAIVTNTTVNTVDTSSSTGIESVASDHGDILHIYPNPNKGNFILQSTNRIYSEYAISDILGHIIAHQIIISDRQTIDLHDIADGVYTLTVKGAQPIRFIIVK